MRYILGFLLFFPALIGAQVINTVGIARVASAPTHTPTAQGARVAIDTLSGDWYEWDPASSSWREMGDRVQYTYTTGAPAFVPSKQRSRLALNAGDSLYVYQGGEWGLVGGAGPDLSSYLQFADTVALVATKSDLVDTATFLIADTILVYRRNGVEIGRDTIRAGALKGNGIAGYLPHYNSANTLDTTGLFWDSANGRLGIGATPTYKLDVYGTDTLGGIQTNVGVNFKRVQPPLNSFTLALGGVGNLGVGLYYYRVTFFNNIGETTASYWKAITTTADSTSVIISGIPVSSDPTVIGRKIYRSKLGLGSSYGWPVITINDNTTTTALDTVSDSVMPALVGEQAIWNKANTTSRFLTVDGFRAMFLDGSRTIFGYRAGESLTVGHTNTLIGNWAGRALTSGSFNTLVGHEVGASLTSGIQNFCLGANALMSATTGSYNVAIGPHALYNTNGNGNIALGYYTGYLVTGSNNVLLGGWIASPGSLSLGSGNIGVGNFLIFPVVNGSNQLNIGNLLYGRGVAQNNLSTTGKIGIRKTTPTATLHVAGEGTTSATTALLVENSVGTAAMVVRDDLKIGIGTSTPAASAIVDMTSTTQGFLPPRMTTAQRDAIASPATGLMVYDTTVNKVSVHNGTEWKYLAYE